MNYLRSTHPPLNEAKPLPALYLPSAYALFGITTLMPGKTARVFITFPVLLLLAVGRPHFTAGGVTEDYGTGGPCLALILMYIDLLILSPHEREPVLFTGRPGRKSDEHSSTRDLEFSPNWEGIKSALRFMTAVRGIGWNWQVKGVPAHPDANMNRFNFVRKRLLLAVRSWFLKQLCLYFMGFAIYTRQVADAPVAPWVLHSIIGWSGGGWALNGVNSLYHLAAALTVAAGVYDPWEWPPMFGPLAEAWSVRQMWSVVWHQLLRRIVQKPGVRLARFLGLRKGTLGSKYLQLYVAFAISLIVHEWQIFNAVRRDVGEFNFFVAQPFVITVEDFAQWCWQRYGPARPDDRLQLAATVVGYIWTFAWFSYCLPPFVEGLLSVGIVGAGYGETWSMYLGQRTVASLLLQR